MLIVSNLPEGGAGKDGTSFQNWVRCGPDALKRSEHRIHHRSSNTFQSEYAPLKPTKIDLQIQALEVRIKANIVQLDKDTQELSRLHQEKFENRQRWYRSRGVDLLPSSRRWGSE